MRGTNLTLWAGGTRACYLLPAAWYVTRGLSELRLALETAVRQDEKMAYQVHVPGTYKTTRTHLY